MGASDGGRRPGGHLLRAWGRRRQAGKQFHRETNLVSLHFTFLYYFVLQQKDLKGARSLHKSQVNGSVDMFLRPGGAWRRLLHHSGRLGHGHPVQGRGGGQPGGEHAEHTNIAVTKKWAEIPKNTKTLRPLFSETLVICCAVKSGMVWCDLVYFGEVM